MWTNELEIPVFVDDEKILLTLFSENSGYTILEKDDAIENGEALFQIKEGYAYEYVMDNRFGLVQNEIVTRSKVSKSTGRICPNIFVGTLLIEVLNLTTNEKCGEFNLEVQSVKASYREDYRMMLEEITEKCHDLILQHSSLTSQKIESDYFRDPKTAYQRFAFVSSIINSLEFHDAVHKITLSPVTKWKEGESVKDIRAIKRFYSSTLRQISSVSNRIPLPEIHSLKEQFHSFPSKVKVKHKIETVDTPENRFIKYALMSFQSFCSDFKSKLSDKSRITNETDLIIRKLEQFLSHSIFKEVSTPTTLPLNSPILQRKEGYREVLRSWLMFDLAAKLVWHGGEDVYSGNKRDVAVLYEYWLFFKLLEIIKEVFQIEPKNIEDLIKETNDGLGLQLKQGRFLPIKGVYDAGTRKLNVEFSYNRTFNGDSRYPQSGSWTKDMRPDYTLSIWPFGLNAESAEKEELIAHIHFDSKYKVDNIRDIVGNDDDFREEKLDQSRGTFKRVDLLKMHSYKDAIRRTAGSYVLYPGTDTGYTKIGFHEIIPGLGAFSIRPSKVNSGTIELTKFLREVVSHFLNRASQREKISLKAYETYREKGEDVINESLPETFGINRNLIPDETFVLIAYYRKENLDWIIKNGLYNARTEKDRGSLRLGPREVGARYILLHSEGETKTGKLMKIVESGPRLFSKQTLIEKGYPSVPSLNYYLVYKVEEVKDKEFLNLNWDITKLEGFKGGRSSSLPFVITLSELMRTMEK